MANKKAEIKSKCRGLYLEELLFEQFREIVEANGKSASEAVNTYMKSIVRANESKEKTETQ